MHVKKGDTVQVVSGKERGRTGQVLRVDLRKNRVYVGGLNMIKRHKRPGPADPEGGIIEREGPIHASNVLLFSEKAERGVRTSYRFVGANGELHVTREAALASFGGSADRVEKVRFCVRTGEVFR
ncbi:MAG: 50S ribosomal protein L24 [Myxococcales bacterium]|nr:50S ribosomal protein L24 [Myxococcales bacterium]